MLCSQVVGTGIPRGQFVQDAGLQHDHRFWDQLQGELFDYDGDELMRQLSDEDSAVEVPVFVLHRSLSKWRTIDADDARNEMQSRVARLREILDLDAEMSQLILAENRWNIQLTLDRFDEDAEAVLSICGIQHFDSARRSLRRNTEGVKCGICFDNIEAGKALSLQCEHWVCEECWENGLSSAVESESPHQLATKRCFHCNVPCGATTFERILSETKPELWLRYQQLCTKDFINAAERLQLCPNPTCEKVVVLPDDETPPHHEVVCDNCKTNFCFLCGHECHAPAPCETVKKFDDEWERFRKDKVASETREWEKKTKRCPQCKSLTEKDGGCLHMTCSRCKFHWCWECGEKFESYAGHRCATRQPIMDRPPIIQPPRHVLESFERFTSLQTMNLDISRDGKHFNRTRTDLVVLGVKGATELLDQLDRGVQALTTGRRVLKYSYVYWRYIQDGKRRDLFGFNVESLETQTSSLEQLLLRDVGGLELRVLSACTDQTHRLAEELKDGVL